MVFFGSNDKTGVVTLVRNGASQALGNLTYENGGLYSIVSGTPSCGGNLTATCGFNSTLVGALTAPGSCVAVLSLTSPAVCQPCVAGTFGNGAFCAACPASSYCTGGALATACPAGTYSAAVNATNATTCSTCSAPGGGQYVAAVCTATTNTGFATITTACPAGQYVSTAAVQGNASQLGSDAVCSPLPPPPPSPAPPPSPPPLSLTVTSTTVLNLSSINASNLVLNTSDLNATVQQQSNLLSSLNHTVTLTNLSASDAANTANVVLALVTATPNVSLAPNSQAQALNVLAAVANVSSPSNVVVLALSNISKMALASNPAALAKISNVMDTLTTSAGSALLTSFTNTSTPPAPTVFSSPNINATVSVALPSALGKAPISAPGSASSFDALPAGLLASSAGANTAVLTEFRAVSFDPWTNATSASLNRTGGSTRLAFSSASGPITVANASTPILFTLPAVSTAGSNKQAVCSFFNTSSGQYSTQGCIAVPNPQPRNHTLSFVPNVTVPSDASLALAWTLQGPMMETNLCDVLVLDCGSNGPCDGPIWGKSCVIYPNPRSPLSVPAVSCPANFSALGLAAPPVMRVYYGEGCALWQPNTFNCTWNNTLQAFNGGGCVSPSNVTRCMCRHLTDFAGARAPKITTCSLSDMTSFSAADIIKKLKTLFEMVVIMFGVMHVGALIGAMQDKAHNVKVLRHVTDAGMGFQLTLAGAWTWNLRQLPLQNDVGAPDGSAVALSGILGFPYIRLRTALPEEYLPGTVGEAIGRKNGLSVTGLESTQSDTDAALDIIREALPLCLGGRLRRKKIPDSILATAEPEAPPSPLSTTMSQSPRSGRPERQNAMRLILPVTGPPDRVPTELRDFVMAYMKPDTPRRQRQAMRALEPRLTPLLESVKNPFADGLALYSPSTPGSVAQTAAVPLRIATDVYDFAFTEARPLQLPVPRRDSLVSTALVFAHLANARCLPIVEFCKRRADAAAHFGDANVRGHTFEDLLGKFMLMLGDDDGSLVVRAKWMSTARLWRLILLQNPDGSFDLNDSLAFALEAHAGPLPPKKSKAEAMAEGLLAKIRLLLSPPDDLDELFEGEEEDTTLQDGDRDGVDSLPTNATDDPLTFRAETVLRAMPKRMERYIKVPEVRQRVWATLLALAWLEEAEATWLMDEEGTTTIVDACYAYFDFVATRQRRLNRHNRLASLHREAEVALRRWRVAAQYAMERARNSDALAKQNALVRFQNAGTRIIKSIMTDHDTFSTFLDTDGFIQRWQRFMILVTLLASSLLTSIWFYSSRGIACCTEIRTLLDTGAGQTCGVVAAAAASDYASNSHVNSINSDRMSQYLLLSPSNATTSSAAAVAAATSTGCDPALSAGPCLGSLGACGDLPTQFANLQGAYTYSTTLQCSSSPGDPSCICYTTLADYVCHAFPDDAYFTDQIFVGLICVAVALPVTMFLERCFEIANEVEGAAESWVAWGGIWRMLLGKRAHKDWRWADADNPPSDFVQLLTTAPGYGALAKFALRKALGVLLRKGAAKDGERSEGAEVDEGHHTSELGKSGLKLEAPSSSGEESKSEEGDARSAALARRLYAAAGLLGVYVTWAIFSWFIFTYGMIIYRRLGPEAEKQFVKTWGVGIGLDQAQQWQDVGKEALKAAALIVILDMLRVTTHRAWFEDFCDFASCQALLFKGNARSLWGQISMLIRHQSRVQAG